MTEETTPESAPEPAPEPASEPASASESATEPASASESATEPATEPEPASEPASKPAPTTPPTTPTTAKDDDKNEATFHAHKSRRVVASSLTNDHDTWMEHLAVVDMLIPDSTARSGEAKYELQIRSFFVSSKTGKKTWDEPPSGAHAIEYANDEIRKTAEDQKKELESVTVNTNNQGDSKKSQGKLTERVMRLMRKTTNTLLGSNDDTKKDSDVNDNKNHQESQEFYYDPNTDLEYAMMKNFNGSGVNEADDLKKAIENSINEANDMDKAIANSTSDIGPVESKDEDELALATATALSLSMKDKAPPKAKNKLLSAYADFERSKKVESDNVSTASSIGRRQNILSGYTAEEIAIATHKVNCAKKKSSSAKSKTRPRRRMRA